MARGGARSKATLKYNREAYYLDALKSGSMSREQMESEYNRLSSIATKRLERFEKSKEWSGAEIYRQYAGSFYGKASAMTDATLMRELADVSNFISTKASSIRGQQQIRNQAIETLHRNGYTFINKSNYKEFTDFMDEVRLKLQALKYPPSEEIVEAFKVAQKHGISNEEVLDDIYNWVEYRDTISKLTKKQTQGLNSSQIMALAKGTRLKKSMEQQAKKVSRTTVKKAKAFAKRSAKSLTRKGKRRR